MPDHVPHTGRGRRPVIHVPKNAPQITPSKPVVRRQRRNRKGKVIR